jgi:prophage DNA circulation protein
MAKPFERSTVYLDEGLLNGVLLQMETIEDSFEKAIARYDYPYADGADLEDMGQKAHSVKIRCYFWDDADQQSYDTHTLLLDSLEDKALLDLVHPKYGLIQGKIESIIVQHDDRERCAVLDITFVEQMRGKLEVTPPADVLSATEEAYIAGQEQQEAKLADDIREILPDDAGAVSKMLDEALGLLAQVQEYSDTAREFVGQVEGYIAVAEAVVDQIMSPVNSLLATITYTESLPGRILGSITRSVEKVALLYTSLRDFPGRFLSTLDDAFRNLQDAFQEFGAADTSAAGQAAREVMTDHLQIVCAQRMALEAAALYAADESATTMAPANRIMNMRELEETLAIVRQRIEAAVVTAREIDSLKQLAVNLLNHVNKIRLEREKMVSVTLDNPMPLHLVCLKYGLPYTDAERLLRINRIRHPNFTGGGVLVYVR